jgi:hypothetical protein
MTGDCSSAFRKKRAAIIIGDSHYGALAGAAERTIPCDANIEADAELFIFNAWKHGLNYPYAMAQDGLWVLNPELKTRLEEITQKFEHCQIFMLFGGGHHSALTMLQHPRPFDFVLPPEPSLPNEESTEMLPYGFVFDLLSHIVAVSLRNMRCIKDAFLGLDCYQIESPAPNGDDQFVLHNLGEWFQKTFPPERLTRVAPRLLRYKMWRVHSLIIEEECAKIGVLFERVPRSSLIHDKFLAAEYYGSDSTHASPLYGRLVLDQIERRLGAKLERWSPFG